MSSQNNGIVFTMKNWESYFYCINTILYSTQFWRQWRMHYTKKNMQNCFTTVLCAFFSLSAFMFHNTYNLCRLPFKKVMSRNLRYTVSNKILSQGFRSWTLHASFWVLLNVRFNGRWMMMWCMPARIKTWMTKIFFLSHIYMCLS